MEEFDILTLGLVGILLLSIPALIASLFPVVEKTLNLVTVSLGLRSAKGIILWVLILGVIFYLTAAPRITLLFEDLQRNFF